MTNIQAVTNDDISRSPPRFLFDVSGLLHWYAYFRHPSGIQRVIEKLVASPSMQNDRRVEFVVRMLGSEDFYRVDSQLLAGLSRASERDSSISRLRAIFAAGMRLGNLGKLLADAKYYHLTYILLGFLRLEALVEGILLRRWPSRPKLDLVEPPGSNDFFFHPGALFGQRRSATSLIGLKVRTGVRLVELIHDLFVYEEPEWFPQGLVQHFSEGLDKLAPHVDFWLTNSSFVKGQVTRFLEKRALHGRRIEVLPMGWDSFDFASRDEPGDLAVLHRLRLGHRAFITFCRIGGTAQEFADAA